MLTLDNFETAISAQIIQRGRDYFQKQAVDSLEENPPGTWTATVEGTEDYEVEVVLAKKNIISQSCDCPYDGGSICKHVVAVLYALREQAAAMPAKKPAKTGKLTFDDLLLKTDLEELRTFIQHYRKENRDFSEKFMLFFAEKDPHMDVASKYTSMVRQIIRSNSKQGFMDYRQTFSFVKEIRAVQHAAETALLQKNYRDALFIGKIIANEVMQLIKNSDDSSGNIGGVLSSNTNIFERIAEAPTVSPELLAQLLEYFEKSLPDKDWFDYGDFGDELLDVVEKVAIRTEPGRYLNLLDTLAKIHTSPHSDYRQESFKKRKIRFYEKIGLPEEAAKLIAASMEIVEVRQNEVKKAIAQKEFAHAKQLVAEGIRIAESKKHPGTVARWEEVLLDIARAQKDVATERHFTKKFAFDGRMKTKYYQQWRATFSPDEWAVVIETLIQSIIAEETKRPLRGKWDSREYTLYLRLSPILIEEEQWERLLKIIPDAPSEGTLAEVHPYLSARYPAEMLAFYLLTLEQLGDNASDRKAYEHLAALMKKVKSDIEGSHDAINDLAARLMQKYPRRPAMLEEMRKVARR